MKYLNKIINKFNSRKIVLKGCNEEEIQKIITLTGGFLPACYIEFFGING